MPTALKRISISMRRAHLRLSLCRGIHFCRIRILMVETTLAMWNIWAINWSTTHGHALTVCRLACATDILPQTEALHFVAAALSHQHFPAVCKSSAVNKLTTGNFKNPKFGIYSHRKQ